MRYLLDLKDHPEVATQFEKMKETSKSYQEQLKFLKKQVEDLDNKVAENRKQFWGNVESYVKGKGILTTYDKEKFFFEIDSDSHQLFLQKHAEKNPADAVKNFIKFIELDLGGGPGDDE